MRNIGYKSRLGQRAGEKNRIARTARWLVVWLVAAVTIGCEPMHTKPREREPDTQAERNFRDLWEACRTVLKRHHFPLDRQDRRDGIFTTYAVSSGHGLEALWRKDAANPFYLQENTVQTILRAVRITLRRLPDRPDEFDFRVEVRMARTNRPPPQINNAAETSEMSISRLPELRFADLRPRDPNRSQPLRGVRANIVPLGLDADLAGRLDREIRRQAGLTDRPVVSESNPTHGDNEADELAPSR